MKNFKTRINYNELASSESKDYLKSLIKVPWIKSEIRAHQYIYELFANRILYVNRLIFIERKFIKHFREFVDKFNKLYSQSYDCTRLLANLRYNKYLIPKMIASQYSSVEDTLYLQSDVLLGMFKQSNANICYRNLTNYIVDLAYRECLHLFDWLINYKSKGISPKKFMKVANRSDWYRSEYLRNLGDWVDRSNLDLNKIVDFRPRFKIIRLHAIDTM